MLGSSDRLTRVPARLSSTMRIDGCVLKHELCRKTLRMALASWSGRSHVGIDIVSTTLYQLMLVTPWASGHS